jgi:hypothetical protein
LGAFVLLYFGLMTGLCEKKKRSLVDSPVRAAAFSSQFDPAPRDENWHKNPRTPDYFL